MKQDEYDKIKKLIGEWSFDKIYAETERGRGFREGQMIARDKIACLIETFKVIKEGVDL